ncbi:MAG: 4a-hydroxytetrahydrobiopterin dehydratase [Nakamurella sp.]
MTSDAASERPSDPVAPDPDVAAALAKLPDWHVDSTGIAATFETGTFARGVALVDAIGVLADSADHHPDIELTYPRVTVRLVTHDAGMRVTTRDTALAADISVAALSLKRGSVTP